MKCFPAMIQSWRQHFDGGSSGTPFIFFQVHSSAFTQSLFRLSTRFPLGFLQLAPWPVNNQDFLPYFRLVPPPAPHN
jgi:hypothetical protein